MNECLVDGERTVIAHDESAEVAQPGNAALDDPTLLVAAQPAAILGRGPVPIGAVRSNQNPERPARSPAISLAPPNPAAVASRWRATETPRASLASEPHSAESTKCLPALCGPGREADRPAVVAVAWEARAGSSPTGRRSVTDHIAPSALPLALFTSAIPLHGKITTVNLAPCTGF